MSFSRDADGGVVVGGVALRTVLAKVPTPFHVYDLDAVAQAAQSLRAGFGASQHLVCYAVKANSAGLLLRRLAKLGLGADVVSGGELALALASGFAPTDIVYSGVAKTDAELDAALAAGQHGVRATQLESVEEAARLAARARAMNRVARVSLRLNPSVEADTHAHIATGHDEAKFGIPMGDLSEALDALAAEPMLELVGVSSHIGSQMTSTDAYARAAQRLCEAARSCEQHGRHLSFLDFGGGFGIDYGDGCPASPADFARVATQTARQNGFANATLLCEPGRSIVGPYGSLVATVVQTKRWKNPKSTGWLFLDAGMNDLLRPALYGARHRIEALQNKPGPTAVWSVAGPVCESSDDFGTYALSDPPPSTVVIRDTGAYGYTMASAYNGRGMASEVFVEGQRITAVDRAGDAAAWATQRSGAR